MNIEVTDQLVAYVARLSRLAQTGAEVVEMKAHFLKILQYIEELRELDTSKVDPSLFSLEASNVYREDEPSQSLPVDDALAAAPQAEPPYFLLPQIVGDGATGSSGQPPTTGPATEQQGEP